MAKTQTRMDKFKDYREQIKKEEILEKEQAEKEIVQVEEPKNKKVIPEPVAVNKHTFEEKKEEKVKAQKNIYDKYLKKRRIKYFLYILFVVALVGGAIALLVIFTGKYLG